MVVYIVASLHMGIFKSQLDMILWNWLCMSRRTGQVELQRFQSQPFPASRVLGFPASDFSIHSKSSLSHLFLGLCCRKGFLERQSFSLAWDRLKTIPTLPELILIWAGHTLPKEWGCQVPPHAVESSLGEECLVGYSLWQLPRLRGGKTASKRMRNARSPSQSCKRFPSLQPPPTKKSWVSWQRNLKSWQHSMEGSLRSLKTALGQILFS